jgi:hypothetical protein
MLSARSRLLVGTLLVSQVTSAQMTSPRKLSMLLFSAFFPFLNHSEPRIEVLLSLRKYGKINHIVNNAGFTFDKMLHTTPDDAFDIIMKIHVRAPFRLIRQAAPYFRVKVAISLLLKHSR